LLGFGVTRRPWEEESGVREGPRPAAVWRKSSASQSDDCVEVAFVGHSILVRDSKDPAGPFLTFTPAEWSAFLAGVENGEFERTA
jgi:hypothetical protein